MAVKFIQNLKKTFLIACISAYCVLAFSNIPLQAAEQDLTELSIEDLMNIEVTSVSKKNQPLSDSAAAIFVISNEDLLRSGATNIPDALRMAPGLNVARIDSNKWAVNIRGATSRFADKLLVLLDGRSIYTPSFSGVYWEVQDVMLEDVERIEVIRGPGATLWGANAVNGVINIITKRAEDTQGGLVYLGGGNIEKAFAGARYGASFGESNHGRLYAKGFKRDEFHHKAGGDAGDDWGMLRGGFRLDSNRSTNGLFTFQGDIYKGEINQDLDLASLRPPYSVNIDDDANVSGMNLIGRWQRTLSSTSEFTLQAYYDRTVRDEAIIEEKRDSFDLDFQYQFKPGDRHDIVCGALYRYTHDDFTNSSVIMLDPDSRHDNLFSFFLQDEIRLVQDRLWLTLGSKFEHNDYSGYEIQPSARLFWAPHLNHKLWTSVSRAVRTPSRVEQDGRLINTVMPPMTPSNPAPFPVAITILGQSNFDSEDLMAYELGYRFIPNQALSFDLSAFYYDYEDLRTSEQGMPIFQESYVEQPIYFSNDFSAHSYGLELAIAWQVMERMKLDFAYSYLASDIEDGGQLGKEPKHTASLRSAVMLSENLDLDVWLRYVDDVTAIHVDSPDNLFEVDDYLTLDLRLAWRPIENLELSLVGQNLLNKRHMEFVQENFTSPTEVERGAYGKVTYRF